jgi:hypothetical protein
MAIWALTGWLSESESYITTDGQSASLSWNEAPVWDLRPDFYYCQTVAGLLIWGALSDERTDLSFIIAPGPCQCRYFGTDSHGTRDHNLLSQIRDFPFSSPPTTRRDTVEVFDSSLRRFLEDWIGNTFHNGSNSLVVIQRSHCCCSL